jgi:hypothetical protein
VFAFSTLWFTHYCLAALHAHRARAVPGDALVAVDVGEQPAQVLPAPPAPPLLPPPLSPPAT